MSSAVDDPLHLGADIGATNARFALLSADGITDIRVLKCADYDGVADAAEAYLAQVNPSQRPTDGAFAIAGPVLGDTIRMTNHPWHFSIEATRRALGLARLDVYNDFTAVALSVPRLGADDLWAVGGGTAVADAPMAVLGPGTGLGVSGLVPGRGGWYALAGEGGHVTLAPRTDFESEVLTRLRRRFDHVSAERCLSGIGLVHLYEAICALHHEVAADLSPEEVTERALADGRDGRGGDIACEQAVALFCNLLGTVASDLALTLGARGGVYIAGGIVPKLGQRFAESGFRSRFTDKGRFADYLEAIPVRVIQHPFPAFLGLQARLDAHV